MKSTIITMLFITISFYFAKAQKLSDVDLLYISGVVFNKDSPAKMQGVHIRFHDSGTVTDAEGRFSIWANPHDTLEVSHVGFQPLKFMISDFFVEKNQSFGIFMTADTVEIAEVLVFRERFRANPYSVFANMKLKQNKENIYARQNLKSAVFSALHTTDNSVWDAERNQQYLQKRMENEALSKGGISDDKMLNIIGIIPFSVLLIKNCQE